MVGLADGFGEALELGVGVGVGVGVAVGAAAGAFASAAGIRNASCAVCPTSLTTWLRPLPGTEISILPPARTTSASATPRPSTRWRMMFDRLVELARRDLRVGAAVQSPAASASRWCRPAGPAPAWGWCGRRCTWPRRAPRRSEQGHRAGPRSDGCSQLRAECGSRAERVQPQVLPLGVRAGSYRSGTVMEVRPNGVSPGEPPDFSDRAAVLP